MKLLAALSLLSSPYTWMMPPGRVPSPDVGDVLLAGKTDRRIGALYFQQAAGDGEYRGIAKALGHKWVSAENLPRSPRSWPRCRTTAGGRKEG